MKSHRLPQREQSQISCSYLLQIQVKGLEDYAIFWSREDSSETSNLELQNKLIVSNTANRPIFLEGCDSHTSSVSVTLEHVRNVNYWATSKTYEISNSGLDPAICVLITFPCDSDVC